MKPKFNNLTVEPNSFNSFKLEERVEYRTEFEREFLLDLEFDSTALTYERLGSLPCSGDQGKCLPFLPCYFVLRDTYQPELVLLDHEEDTAGEKGRIIKQQTENFASKNGLIYKVLTRENINHGNLMFNLDFLYNDVNSPFSEADVFILREIFQEINSMAIGALKMLVVNESVINTLLFHKALSADLCGEVINNHTKVSKGLLFDDYIGWVEQITIGNLAINN